MDLKALLIMFISFTVEMVIAGVMLIKHRLTFRFKAYIAIPVGLIIACSGAQLIYVVFISLLNQNNGMSLLILLSTQYQLSLYLVVSYLPIKSRFLNYCCFYQWPILSNPWPINGQLLP